MSYGIIENPKFHILEYLDASAFILNTKDNLGKFDSKADEGIFLGYSTLGLPLWLFAHSCCSFLNF